MSFQQGLSGLNAAAKNLDAVSNNVSNAGTVGYKGASAQFADVFAASLAGGGSGQIGIGVNLSQVKQSFTQGNITVTNNPLDIAINGGGFFRMSDNGAISFTRNGQFLVDKDGYVVNSSGARLTGYAANAAGVIVPSSPTDLMISSADLVPNATTAGNVGLNLDSRDSVPAAFVHTDPTTYNSSTAMTVYDSLGNSHVMTLYFRKTAPNAWDMHVGLDGAAPASTTALAFDSSGALTTAMPVTVLSGVDPATGAANLTVSLDMTSATQFGSTFGVTSLTQDGYTSGRLAGLSVSSEGIIQGRYSNGQSRDLGQVVLANFANPNGLQPLGGNQWSETAASGQPLVGAPNSGSLGALQSAAIEESNIDLTAELVNMITAQRNYQANAQSIKAQDAIMQTLVNLR
ncbi:MAG: flagellar hook protein FlgE [Rhodocyclaceae bacterium]|jgi:flagellar hook protein FlgE|nr:Flagellar hook protein FlgE [Rhodocyclaceae bacterium]MBZ0145012.1 flagellar hook protein FlgE [Rhodocyclaceae bacterium]MCC6879261.1 flagellar hook protein FlgE [Rhodocyclaceae bacterium]MCL4682028.1 flagellar hook protein FlgE [Rhodocyclaceae bacterium]